MAFFDRDTVPRVLVVGREASYETSISMQIQIHWAERTRVRRLCNLAVAGRFLQDTHRGEYRLAWRRKLHAHFESINALAALIQSVHQMHGGRVLRAVTRRTQVARRRGAPIMEISVDGLGLLFAAPASVHTMATMQSEESCCYSTGLSLQRALIDVWRDHALPHRPCFDLSRL